MKFSLSKRSKERLDGVESEIIEIVNLAIIITKIDFGIPEHGGFRTKEAQRELFDKNLSKADGTIVKSYHQSGEAFDVYAFFDGKASWKEEHLTFVATAILQSASILGHGLEWGGLWRTNKKQNEIPYGWDMAHFQLKEKTK